MITLSNIPFRIKHVYHKICKDAVITAVGQQYLRKYCSSFSNDSTLDTDVNELMKDNTIKSLIPRSMRVSGMPHQVYIVQPYIKWGKKQSLITTPQLQLEEAVSLINTLPGWNIIDSKIISSVSFEKKTFFNSGQLDAIKTLCRNQLITALFINIKALKLKQLLFLEKHFNIPVFDRYSIIINIFKIHAHTKEAKLQVALAEIPYIFSRICGVNDKEVLMPKNVTISSSVAYKDKRFQALNDQKRKILKQIAELRKRRDILRNKRRVLQLPIVAVVGYTNVGKTSLIKCLSNEAELTPQDKLFATLDVTTHAVDLPCKIKAIFIDTIGFITDIPTDLLEPFVATLEDAILADVIIHVKDVSHPDHRAQEKLVLETLDKLKLPQPVLDNIITVGNKCDKNELLKDNVDDKMYLISCHTQFGIENLKHAIADAIIRAQDMKRIRIKVKNGGSEYQWLLKESAVAEIVVDIDPQYVVLDIFITKAKFNIFKHKFIDSC